MSVKNKSGLVPGVVRLLELQPEGRRIMTVREFHNGARVAIGDRFVDA